MTAADSKVYGRDLAEIAARGDGPSATRLLPSARSLVCCRVTWMTVPVVSHLEARRRQKTSPSPLRLRRTGDGPGVAGAADARRSSPRWFPPLGKIERMDPAFDHLIAQDAELEKLADGFDWAEGPVWIKNGGFLLFSDIPKNSIFKWSEGRRQKRLSPSQRLRNGPARPAGAGLERPAHRAARPADPDGARRPPRGQARKTKKKTAWRTHVQGKRLNSPNDGVFKSNGDLYFTDPPYGLKAQGGRRRFPGMELDFCGVYRLSKDGKVTLLTKEMTKPNGIAFSPDEKTLYVANSDPKKAVWMAFDVKEDGTLGKGRVFFDATEFRKDLDEGHRGLPDGMKVDKDGNLFATGPGGVLVFTPEASTWAPSPPASPRPTATGATTARRCTSRADKNLRGSRRRRRARAGDGRKKAPAGANRPLAFALRPHLGGVCPFF